MDGFSFRSLLPAPMVLIPARMRAASDSGQDAPALARLMVNEEVPRGVAVGLWRGHCTRDRGHSYHSEPCCRRRVKLAQNRQGDGLRKISEASRRLNFDVRRPGARDTRQPRSGATCSCCRA